MVQVVTFCHGCNEKFDIATTGAGCPFCGLALKPLDLASTVDFADVVAREACTPGTVAERTLADPFVGRELEHYRIEELIGRGGMARVYRGFHKMLHRPCALKLLSPQLVERDPAFVEMFFNEARTAAALVHPNVVTIHNICVEDSLHYIEMEFVEGYSLQRLVEDHGALQPVRATNLMLQSCAALAQAHQVGMIHRDLKPSNVLVTADGKAKLADFGLAKKVISDELLQTRVGLVGTPYFMAPELFNGAPASKRGDVYAAGVTYFYLLSGRLPFQERSVTRLAKAHAQDPVPDLYEYSKEAPSGVGEVISKCLAKNESERYPDAGALYDELKSVFGNLRDMDTLIREAFEGRDIEWKGENDSYEVSVKLEDGRSQRVFIQAGVGETVSRSVVKIFSVAGPLREKHARRALELNASIPYNSIAVQNIQGEPYFIMVQTYPRATCDPEEVRQSVLSTARWADVVEAFITGQDRF